MGLISGLIRGGLTAVGGEAQGQVAGEQEAYQRRIQMEQMARAQALADATAAHEGAETEKIKQETPGSPNYDQYLKRYLQPAETRAAAQIDVGAGHDATKTNVETGHDVTRETVQAMIDKVQNARTLADLKIATDKLNQAIATAGQKQGNVVDQRAVHEADQFNKDPAVVPLKKAAQVYQTLKTALSQARGGNAMVVKSALIDAIPLFDPYGRLTQGMIKSAGPADQSVEGRASKLAAMITTGQLPPAQMQQLMHAADAFNQANMTRYTQLHAALLGRSAGSENYVDKPETLFGSGTSSPTPQALRPITQDAWNGIQTMYHRTPEQMAEHYTLIPPAGGEPAKPVSAPTNAPPPPAIKPQLAPPPQAAPSGPVAAKPALPPGSPPPVLKPPQDQDQAGQ